MVILFSGRRSKTEKEIIEILKSHGATYISDKNIEENNGLFTIISTYKKTDIELEKGIAVFIDNTDRFENQVFPIGIIGVCEDNNHKGLEIFKKNGIAVISCGINLKNTITLSSISDGELLATLQRTVTDNLGNIIDPSEFKIKLTREYSPFAIMACVAVLLLNGILPKEF